MTYNLWEAKIIGIMMQKEPQLIEYLSYVKNLIKVQVNWISRDDNTNVVHSPNSPPC